MQITSIIFDALPVPVRDERLRHFLLLLSAAGVVGLPYVHLADIPDVSCPGCCLCLSVLLRGVDIIINCDVYVGERCSVLHSGLPGREEAEAEGA